MLERRILEAHLHYLRSLQTGDIRIEGLAEADIT